MGGAALLRPPNMAKPPAGTMAVPMYVLTAAVIVATWGAQGCGGASSGEWHGRAEAGMSMAAFVVAPCVVKQAPSRWGGELSTHRRRVDGRHRFCVHHMGGQRVQD